jgi:hypothetical protein
MVMVMVIFVGIVDVYLFCAYYCINTRKIQIQTQSKIKHKPKMKTKRFRQSCHTRRRATRRNCKKGGMHSARVFGKFAKKVMGEGADRVDKMKDIVKAIEEGLTQQPSEKGKQRISSLPKYFSASPSPLSPSFAAVSKTPPRKFHHVGDVFKTPEHDHPHHNVNKTPPNLGTRARLPRETQQDRRQRLGFSVAPTMANTVSVVGELFP